jgi:hypothetical protein
MKLPLNDQIEMGTRCVTRKIFREFWSKKINRIQRRIRVPQIL